jgi:hypothetical protein
MHTSRRSGILPLAVSVKVPVRLVAASRRTDATAPDSSVADMVDWPACVTEAAADSVTLELTAWVALIATAPTAAIVPLTDSGTTPSIGAPSTSPSRVIASVMSADDAALAAFSAALTSVVITVTAAVPFASSELAADRLAVDVSAVVPSCVAVPTADSVKSLV